MTRRITILFVIGDLDVGGVVQHPWRALRHASFLVLPSRYEGFPNVLCEAMANGLPVIATDCPCGPADIVRHGVDGLLVPAGDSDALAVAMARLISDASLCTVLAMHATEITERFSSERILDKWDTLLNEMRLR